MSRIAQNVFAVFVVVFLLTLGGIAAVRYLPARTAPAASKPEQRSGLKADPTPPAPAPAPVAPPRASINGPLTATAGQFLLYDGSGASGGTIHWAVFPSAVSMVSDDGTKLALAGNPPFTLVQVVVQDATHFDVALQTVGLPAPIPTPVPPTPPTPPTPPAPPTPPTPTASSLWLVAIDDATVRTEATAAVLSNASYWAGVTNSGDKWNILDKSNPRAADFAPEITEAGGLPVLVVLDGNVASGKAKVLGAVKLPATTAGIDAIRKQYKGQ